MLPYRNREKYEINQLSLSENRTNSITMSNTYNDNLRHKFPIKANMIYDLFWRRGDNDFVRLYNIAEKTSPFKKYAKYQYIIEN